MNAEVAQGGAQQDAIGNVADDQQPPLRCPAVALGKVVIDDRAVTRSGESLAGVAANVAGPAGHEDARGVGGYSHARPLTEPQPLSPEACWQLG